MTDGVSPARGGHRAHPERQRHLLGKVIQQRVEAFEAAFVDGHFDSPELAVSALVEGDAFGWAHMGKTRRLGRVGLLGRGEGRGMLFRWGERIPHPDLDRLHCVWMSYSHILETWSKLMSQNKGSLSDP